MPGKKDHPSRAFSLYEYLYKNVLERLINSIKEQKTTTSHAYY